MQFLFFILMRLSNIVKRILSYPPTFLTYLSKKKKFKNFKCLPKQSMGKVHDCQ